MNLKITFLYFCGTVFLLLNFQNVFADDLRCDFTLENRPCLGAPGQWTTNADNSEGGFVANTAYVESTSFFGYAKKNVPYIGRCVQVCESARVEGEDAVLNDRAKISGSAQISGSSMIFQQAHVFGNARVFGDAQVYGASKVSGEVQFFGTVNVMGAAWIQGNEVAHWGVYFFDDTDQINMEDTQGHENSHSQAQERSSEDPVMENETPFNISMNRISLIASGPINDRLMNSAPGILLQLNNDKLKVESQASPRQEITSRIEQIKSRIAQLQNELKQVQDELEQENTKQEEFENQYESCPICFDPLYRTELLVLSHCGHLLCQRCFERISPQRIEGIRCPQCRASHIESGSLRVHYRYRE